jgi:hypothetical protein
MKMRSSTSIHPANFSIGTIKHGSTHAGIPILLRAACRITEAVAAVHKLRVIEYYRCIYALVSHTVAVSQPGGTPSPITLKTRSCASLIAPYKTLGM